MTQEEKQLLLIDLCARLPYGVKGRVYTETTNGKYDISGDMIFFDSPFDVTLDTVNTSTEELHVVAIGNEDTVDFIEDQQVCGSPFIVEDFKPYLRPMSSMTEEEKKEEDNTVMMFLQDFYNSHHFDYRGLIEKGLALEAPDGMYNKEKSQKGSKIPIPKTVDEAVKTLAKIVSEEDRDYLFENGAISMHDSLGRWIRNEWGLWTGSELKNELKKKGFEHPDDMSNYIIEEFIKYWNNKL